MMMMMMSDHEWDEIRHTIGLVMSRLTPRASSKLASGVRVAVYAVTEGLVRCDIKRATADAGVDETADADADASASAKAKASVDVYEPTISAATVDREWQPIKIVNGRSPIIRAVDELTVRDVAALAALTGLLAYSGPVIGAGGAPPLPATVVRRAMDYADAFVAERQRRAHVPVASVKEQP
jgi:hypothetical protein